MFEKYYSSKDYYKIALDIAKYYPGSPDTLKAMLIIQYDRMLYFIGESDIPTIEKILALSSWGLPLFAIFDGPDYIDYDSVLNKILSKKKLPKELKELIQGTVIDLGMGFHCEDLLE